jgi:hypothetical protein
MYDGIHPGCSFLHGRQITNVSDDSLFSLPQWNDGHQITEAKLILGSQGRSQSRSYVAGSTGDEQSVETHRYWL